MYLFNLIWVTAIGNLLRDGAVKVNTLSRGAPPRLTQWP